MTHHWQEHFGTPSEGNHHHNQEWADKMESLGLMPSKSGLPGGKRTGRSISHYIIQGGKFSQSCTRLIENGFILPWMDRHLPTTKEGDVKLFTEMNETGIGYSSSKLPISHLTEKIDHVETVFRPVKKAPKVGIKQKLTCPRCESNAWVAHGTRIICGECDVEMKK